ncbi:unnamed protein product, partial [Didymodactylos carnosus]
MYDLKKGVELPNPACQNATKPPDPVEAEHMETEIEENKQLLTMDNAICANSNHKLC